jgi:hypothetical protein
VSRGLRQTLALELKVIRYKDELAREAAEDAEEAAAVERFAVETHAQAVAGRREAIRDHASGAIWTEAEDLEGRDFETPDDPERLAGELEAWLDAAVRRPDFLRADIDLLVIEACEAIGADPNILYEIHDRGRPAPPVQPPEAQPPEPQPRASEPADSS